MEKRVRVKKKDDMQKTITEIFRRRPAKTAAARRKILRENPVYQDCYQNRPATRQRKTEGRGVGAADDGVRHRGGEKQI